MSQSHVFFCKNTILINVFHWSLSLTFRNSVEAYKKCMGPIIKKASVNRKCPDLVVEMYTALSNGYKDGYNYLCSNNGFKSK